MKNNVLFLGCTQNYGYSFSAANTKVEFLCKGLTELGDCCSIHNGVVGSPIVNKRECTSKDVIDNIITYPIHLHKLISFIFNIHLLHRDLRQIKKNGYNNVVILEFPDYHIYILYWFIARFLKYKIVVISHEWGLTVKGTHILRKPLVWLYSKTFGYFSDGILPISEYIILKIKPFNKPYLKIPILAEFNKLLSPKERVYHSHYFLYCVYAAYSRVIFFVIDSFEKYYKVSRTKKDLILVLSGDSEQIKKIEEYIIKHDLQEKIKIKTKLPFEKLLSLYERATALIVPLNPDNEQDKARFSQKIAEYLSSATPIITNAVGEINYYFKANENIIIVPEYTTESYCDILLWVDKNVEQAQLIGHRGYEIGSIFFDYKKYGKLLSDFLKII